MNEMINNSWVRALLLVLLGMGTFFVLAALMALLVWLVAGNWRPFLQVIALLGALASILTATYLWVRFVAR